MEGQGTATWKPQLGRAEFRVGVHVCLEDLPKRPQVAAPQIEKEIVLALFCMAPQFSALVPMRPKASVSQSKPSLPHELTQVDCR